MTIKEAVDTILRLRPYLEEFLYEGLINTTALARKISPEIIKLTGKEPKTGAIVMAIQRHNPGKLLSADIKASSLMSNISNIIVRSDILVHTYNNSATLADRLTELSMLLSKKKRVFYTFSQGVFETTLIFGKRAIEDIKKVMEGEEIIAKAVNQSCITLYLPDENTSIPGYYYYILKLIAWEGINITEILSTTNEFSIILDKKYVDKAFSVLKR